MLKLSSHEKSTLTLTVASLLKEANVGANGVIRFRAMRGIHVKAREEIGDDLDDKIAEICGELGLIDFLRFTISRNLLASDEYSRKRISKLSAVSGYQDALSAAQILVKDLSNLPHKLRICSPLPSSFTPVLFHNLEDFDLGRGNKIIRADKLLDENSIVLESKDLERRILQNIDEHIIPRSNQHFLCTWHSGFAGSFSGNHSVQDHLDRLRALHGCLLAIGAIDEDSFFESLPQHAVVVHRAIEDSIELAYADTVDSDLKYFYENFDVTSDYYALSERISHDKSGLLIYDIDDDELESQKIALSALKKIFSPEDYSRSLLTSCLWLFRAFVSTRLVDVVLDSTIALEVLLGDREASEGLGLTNLLANRCGFLLGKSSSERHKLIDEFKAIYNFRSKIVHEGLHKADRKASGAGVQARNLAQRVLDFELTSDLRQI